MPVHGVDPNNPSRRVCDCSAHCGTPGKSVSISTYNRHARDRHRDRFGAPLTAFLAALEPNNGAALPPQPKRKVLPNVVYKIRKQQRTDLGKAHHDRALDPRTNDTELREPDDLVRNVCHNSLIDLQ